MSIYAYVTSQCCTRQRAVRPGEEVNGTPISKHGDYSQWRRGKRETLEVLANPDKYSIWGVIAAGNVARLMGWEADQ